MPSTAAPTHYERSSGIMPSQYDSFFKAAATIAAGFGTDGGTGDVEAPLGYVTLHQLSSDEISAIIEDADLTDEPVPDEGWYIVREDDNGLIWAMTYGSTESTLAEENARADYAEAQETYAAWVEAADYYYGG